MSPKPSKTPRRGRPPLADELRRDRQPRPLYIKLTPAERVAIDQAAERAGLRVTDWARRLLFAEVGK